MLSFTTPAPTLDVLNLDFLKQFKYFNIVRSCNGFLLCMSEPGAHYFVCNPITRDFTTLNNHPFGNRGAELYLAFDPSISPHYKVISVLQQLVYDKSVFVDDWVFNEYCFKTRSWSPGVSFRTKQLPGCHNAKGVYCNRAIYWCTNAEFSMYFDIDAMLLTKYWRMPLSNSEWVNRSIKYFGESGVRLHLAVKVAKQTFKYDIFELEENYSRWSLRHRVDLSPVRHMIMINGGSFYDWGFNIVRPVKEEKSMLVLVAIKQTLIVYDPLTSTKLCEIKMGPTAQSIKSSISLGKVFHYLENNALVEACTDKPDSTRQLCCAIL
ncbi:F-box protein At5g07610-like [Lotus japonicus]|uniref:F-box protein At5g07610-like n=1 Tax=Lotus japonicus TaxID=34305 RepID=UPI00258719EF|nr:F-box protein At5g07610-like [Lotus japonicus]